MKIVKLSLLIILGAMLFTRCINDDMPKMADASSILGNWKQTEAFISSGGPQYWVDIENGEEINFFEDRTFSSDRYSECSNGNFVIEENKLILEYSCLEFNPIAENEDGLITYDLELYNDNFILTPTSGPLCIEGCSYKYQHR
ncbi:MAG: hypothetical protein ACI836_001018 [Saprospiraceae bacterium]|jgi:hypothetical protein